MGLVQGQSGASSKGNLGLVARAWGEWQGHGASGRRDAYPTRFSLGSSDRLSPISYVLFPVSSDQTHGNMTGLQVVLNLSDG